jgi:ribonuclease III
MIFKARRFAALEGALGYKFKSEMRLERALTHASVRGTNAKRSDNEVFEFIGDRVLGLAIVQFLHETYPNETEGELARRYNLMVRGETCARVARVLNLGPHLILSASEAEAGGRDKDNILADAIEAILGAIFLDGGFDKARDVIRRIWTSERGPTTAVGADPKTALQEWAQGLGLALPHYSHLGRTGPDHAPQFTAEVRITGRLPQRGEGPSKRAAEQAAASAMLAAVTAEPETSRTQKHA